MFFKKLIKMCRELSSKFDERFRQFVILGDEDSVVIIYALDVIPLAVVKQPRLDRNLCLLGRQHVLRDEVVLAKDRIEITK